MEIDLKQLLNKLGLAESEFRDTVVVVTGAGRGIGLQTARAFALLGGKVVIAEISKDGKQAEEQIRAEGGKALYVQTDVSDSASVTRLAQATRKQFGPVDILVNNAIRCPVATVAEMDENLWDQVIAVNLRGTFLTCKAFIPDMLAHKSGIIINMVSPTPCRGYPLILRRNRGSSASASHWIWR